MRGSERNLSAPICLPLCRRSMAQLRVRRCAGSDSCRLENAATTLHESMTRKSGTGFPRDPHRTLRGDHARIINQSAMAIRHKAIALCGGSEVRQSWPSSSRTENSILSSGCAKMRRKADALLSFGTPIERTASESAFKRRTHLFTARCRRPLGPPHYIQHGPRALAIGGRRQGLTRGRTRPRTHKPVGVTRR